MKKFILIMMVSGSMFFHISLGQAEITSPGAVTAGAKGLSAGSEAIIKTLLVPLINGLSGFAQESNDFMGHALQKIMHESSAWSNTEQVTFGLGFIIGYFLPVLASTNRFATQFPHSNIASMSLVYTMGSTALGLANFYKQIFNPGNFSLAHLSNPLSLGLKEQTLAGLRSPLMLLLKGYEGINKDAHNFVEQLKKESAHWSLSQKTLFSTGFIIGTLLPVITVYLGMKSFPTIPHHTVLLGTTGIVGTTFARIMNILLALTESE